MRSASPRMFTLLFALALFGLAATTACENSPTSDDYCTQNPQNCETPAP